VDRVTAAVATARAQEFPFTLTARAENHIRGNPDLADTIERLQAFDEAGADVLYAPGLRTPDEIRAVCASTSKPVNVLAPRGLRLRELVDAGAQRISLGGALAWAAVAATAAPAERVRADGAVSLLGTSERIPAWLGG
jgi:2-methylisocitrate lyase-like PEP mutase family enzyme